MPIYRHECAQCGIRVEGIFSLSDPSPEHCESPMIRLMPSRVIGKVVGSIAAEVAAANAKDDIATVQKNLAESRAPKAIDKDDPHYIPPAKWTTGIGEVSKTEAADRWRDTRDAFTSWQTKSLVASGMEYSKAKTIATETQTKIVAKAQAQAEAKAS